MALKVSKADVWAVTLEDRAGGAADKLEGAGEGRREPGDGARAPHPEQPGKGVMFVTPLKGAKAMKAAQDAGMGKPENIHSVRIEGGDKAGPRLEDRAALGDAGVSFRGMSAAAIGKKFVSYIACDTADDQARAIAALKKANSSYCTR